MTDAVLTFLILAIVCIWAKHVANCADDWLIHPPGSLAEKIDEEEREMKNKLVAKFNPDGTLKSLTTAPPNATGETSSSRPTKRTTRSGRRPSWQLVQGWKKSGKNWKRKRKRK